MSNNYMAIILAYRSNMCSLARAINSIIRDIEYGHDLQLFVIDIATPSIEKLYDIFKHYTKYINIVKLNNDYGAYVSKILLAKKLLNTYQYNAILFLDDDAFLLPKSTEILYKYLFINRVVGATQPVIYNPDGSFQAGLMYVNSFGYIRTKKPKKPTYSLFPAGCCFMIKSRVLRDISINPYIDTWYDDVDLGLKMISSRYLTLVIPYAKAVHGKPGRQYGVPSKEYQLKRAKKHTSNYIILINDNFLTFEKIALYNFFLAGYPFTLLWYLKNKQPYACIGGLIGLLEGLHKLVNRKIHRIEFPNIKNNLSRKIFKTIMNYTKGELFLK